MRVILWDNGKIIGTGSIVSYQPDAVIVLLDKSNFLMRMDYSRVQKDTTMMMPMNSDLSGGL